MTLYPEPLIATGERPEPWEQTFTLAASDLTFLWRACPVYLTRDSVPGSDHPGRVRPRTRS